MLLMFGWFCGLCGFGLVLVEFGVLRAQGGLRLGGCSVGEG